MNIPTSVHSLSQPVRRYDIQVSFYGRRPVAEFEDIKANCAEDARAWARKICEEYYSYPIKNIMAIEVKTIRRMPC